ncbi:DUF6053 domain-containing protein [Lysobacter yananisis]|uniref:DUF6053 domain-containing protein n=1 Tax=Lysobacter yananisis TaxID=1003114 RepID=UPI003CE5589A
MAYVGSRSGPMLSARVAAIRNQSIGPEGPPTTARKHRPQARALPILRAAVTSHSPHSPPRARR